MKLFSREKDGGPLCEPGAKHTGTLGTRAGKTGLAGMVVMKGVRRCMGEVGLPLAGGETEVVLCVVFHFVLLGT